MGCTRPTSALSSDAGDLDRVPDHRAVARAHPPHAHPRTALVHQAPTVLARPSIGAVRGFVRPAILGVQVARSLRAPRSASSRQAPQLGPERLRHRGCAGIIPTGPNGRVSGTAARKVRPWARSNPRPFSRPDEITREARTFVTRLRSPNITRTPRTSPGLFPGLYAANPGFLPSFERSSFWMDHQRPAGRALKSQAIYAARVASAQIA